MSPRRGLARPGGALLCACGLLWAWIGPALASGQTPCPLAWGLALEGHPITAEAIARARRDTGLDPKMVVFFLQWPAPDQPQDFPAASLEAITSAGALPCLTWEPMHQDPQGREVMVSHQDLLAGRYDAYISGFARAAAAWGRPLVVRLAHEMNLARYHWGTEAGQYGPGSPAIYQRMHRYVVDLCRREGAGNLLWAFCPNAESNPHPRWHGAPWNTATAYYPGGDYVDIMGMDGYNWGPTRTKAEHGWDSRWLGFRQTFGELRGELSALAPEKPLVVFETSSAARGGDRTAWLREALRDAGAWRIRALVWFQVDKEIDWRLLKDRDGHALELVGEATRCQGGPLAELTAARGQPALKERR